MEYSVQENQQRFSSKPKHPVTQSSSTPEHRDLRQNQWRHIPAWREVDEEQFNNHQWQQSNSPTRPQNLGALLGDLIEPQFLDDILAGFTHAPMSMRITPYLISLIDWSQPVTDPIRRQFLPLDSEQEPDHPMCTWDALEEQRDAVAPGLTHRYPDKVLFLALDVCPVYCRFCTRSYSIGSDTQVVDKIDFRPKVERWDLAFAYLRQHQEVEDVVVSGGDISLLNPRLLEQIGQQLLSIPHIRRIRLATKGLAIMPQKVLSDHQWLDAVTTIAEQGRARGVHVCVHTHFNHPNEISELSKKACHELFQRGISIRNQSVLLRGVNDDKATMICLLRRLSWINVQPYYVYIHDMVPGVETLRTTLADAIELEKQVRGQTAGFMTPTFVCDAVGGGGKRDLHSYEIYDQSFGVAIYRSPVVDSARPFFYFDPLRALSAKQQSEWRSASCREQILNYLVKKTGLRH